MNLRVHGNGFIQLDLDETKRLHVWGDRRIPKQSVSTQIHNHIFSFTSTIRKGRLIHIEYEIILIDNGPFEIYEAVVRSGQDTILQTTGQRCIAVPCQVRSLLPGESYGFVAGLFHENCASEPTVSIMTKKGKTLAENPEGPRPKVLVPFDSTPDNRFNRYQQDSLLWDIVLEHIKGMDDLYKYLTP